MLALPPDLGRALQQGGERLTVLVVRLAALGDVLRTLPAVGLLRRALPRCRLHWVVDDRWAHVLADRHDLDGIYEFPRKAWQAEGRSIAALAGRARWVRRARADLRRLAPDLSLDFHGNLRSGLLVRLAGAPVRVGYARPQSKELNAGFNTHLIPSAPLRTPRIERNLSMLRALGLPDSPLPLGDLPLAVRGRDVADEIIRGHLGDRPFAVMSPGASRAQAYKKPPAAALAAAIPALEAEGLTALVVWGPGEEGDAREVCASGPSAVLAPATDLAALAALIARARLFVGGDSGPMHLACSLGCPVVAVYGPTDPVINGPWGVPSRTVFPRGRTYSGIKRLDRRRGFEGLDPLDVAAAVSEILRS